MKKIWEKIGIIKRQQKKYFDEFGEEISVRNLQLMETICCAGIAIFCLYFLFTKVFFSSWSISLLYLVPVPILGVLLWEIKKNLKKEKINTKAAYIQIVCMYIFLLMVTIVLSVFPHPNVPSI